MSLKHYYLYLFQMLALVILKKEYIFRYKFANIWFLYGMHQQIQMQISTYAKRNRLVNQYHYLFISCLEAIEHIIQRSVSIERHYTVTKKNIHIIYANECT